MNTPPDREEEPGATREPGQDPSHPVEIAQPHDRLIKVLLSHPETVGYFLRENLPAEIVAQLAPELPELVEGSFVPDALSLFLSDRLFRVRLVEGSPAFVHLLIEHKSHPDRKVGWQITRGIMASTEQSIREMGKGWEKLPAVIPWPPWNKLPTLCGMHRNSWSRSCSI
ncbi:MAG: Rpn family recombination-promoting nuclease/putative transposase [Magnetococcales bacterium]|nr:Rpn family recombination-promoting nuclease/putative transposase [Magnetococcales bacterium]